jgi:serine protease AprX
MALPNGQFPTEDEIRRLVFETFGMRRFTQDSPVQPDVWIRFLKLAGRGDLDTTRVSLLLVSKDTAAADGTPSGGGGQLAEDVRAAILNRSRDQERKPSRGAAKVTPEPMLTKFKVAATSRAVAIDVTFEEMLTYLIPKTYWWSCVKNNFRDPAKLGKQLEGKYEEPIKDALLAFDDTEFFRFVALSAVVRYIADARRDRKAVATIRVLINRLAPVYEQEEEDPDDRSLRREEEGSATVANLEELWESYAALARRTFVSNVGKKAEKRTTDGAAAALKTQSFIWAINRNRRMRAQAAPPVNLSIHGTIRSPARLSSLTVKADAAITLFSISTNDLTWAVVDTGIDANHPAFVRMTADKTSSKMRVIGTRVVGTLDFTRLRNLLAEEFDVGDLIKKIEWEGRPTRQEQISRVHKTMDSLRRRNVNGRELDWTLVEPLIRLNPQTAPSPPDPHGTHVAGILAGGNLPTGVAGDTEPFRGVCPDIQLYDLRVFADDGENDEFTILAAIEYISWINRDPARPIIHGVNLSLATAHVVDAHACGRTPICESCNRLSANGTVVVAAAGNSGFDKKERKETLGTGYRSISITDPGNAEDVITVGATHRNDPHTYGVSYFSSRGPTGDGRMKPDLVAPGEKIRSTAPGGKMLVMDGTSMAAPHVSGVCALLMARHRELIGQPRRIKEVLMRTATDLGRERSFQGAGLVDALRALQSL